MKKTDLFMEGLGIKTICIIAFMLLAVITWWTARYTSLYQAMLDYSYTGHEVQILYPDTPLKNLIAAFAMSVILGFLSWLFFTKRMRNKKTKFVKYLAIIEIIGIGVLLTLWVTITQFEQQRDAGMVYAIAQQFLQDDYNYMKLNYIQYYQHQLNLIFLEEPILRLGGRINLCFSIY